MVRFGYVARVLRRFSYYRLIYSNLLVTLSSVFLISNFIVKLLISMIFARTSATIMPCFNLTQYDLPRVSCLWRACIIPVSLLWSFLVLCDFYLLVCCLFFYRILFVLCVIRDFVRHCRFLFVVRFAVKSQGGALRDSAIGVDGRTRRVTSEQRCG